MYHTPDAMDRCEMILTGTVALSPSRTCTTTQRTSSTPKSVRSRMMRQLPQAYLLPPHCRARSSEMTQGMRRRVPRRSNLARKVLKVGLEVGVGASGSLTRKRMAKKVMPPRGRLIQKHHPIYRQYNNVSCG